MMKFKTRCKNFFINLKNKIIKFFKELPSKFKRKFAGAKEIIAQGNSKVMSSFVFMGAGQLLYKQWAKGALPIGN